MSFQRDLLFLGSVPLTTTREVMSVVAGALGERLKRIPDGETGARSKFITWQGGVLDKAEQFEMRPLGPQSEWGPNGELPPPVAILRPGTKGTPKFPPTGYAAEALKSYEVFADLKRKGAIHKDARFQVGLPSPLGVIGLFMEPDGQKIAEKPYEARMAEDIRALCAGIPHRDLTLQWDIPFEIAVWEGARETYLSNPREQVIEKLARIIALADADVETGLHVCYGDVSHRHWKQPDLGVMVSLINALLQALPRPLNYIHIPIPRHWTEPSRYQQLSNLKLQPATQVYLGLIHQADGLEGAKRRISSASEYLSRFGAAASCGLGRRQPDDIPQILSLHRDVADLRV
jgi:hypothetical protein